ncbi:hypothetical protein J25TS5_46790 [Paenibacillus faecis]|nr:hypothetical protein J25TS5_46790 [Paenibacillus faecis]
MTAELGDRGRGVRDGGARRPGRQVSARWGRNGARRKPGQRRASGRVAEPGGSAGWAE